jgi:microcystin-dependent protein
MSTTTMNRPAQGSTSWFADVDSNWQKIQGALNPPGVMQDYCGTTAPTGWVLASGRTIGSATSGGTERANADTVDLYTLLWDSFANTELPIQDSTGTATTRGASAAADFAANKRMPVPDLRGRIPAGKDNMGGTTASRLTSGGSGITGTTMGAAGGVQTVTLQATEMPVHNHGVTDPGHSHAMTSRGSDLPQGGNGRFADGAWNVTNGPSTVSNTTGISIQNAGGSGATTQAHNNTQPTIILTKIIKL